MVSIVIMIIGDVINILINDNVGKGIDHSFFLYIEWQL